jgi:hypothetical protein
MRFYGKVPERVSLPEEILKAEEIALPVTPQNWNPGITSQIHHLLLGGYG